MIPIITAIGEALGLVRSMTDPDKKKQAIQNYLTKKVLQDVLQAKKIIFHEDKFHKWLMKNMGVKDEKDKKKLKWYFTRYEKLKKEFIL